MSKNPKNDLFMEELFVHADALLNFGYYLSRNEEDANDLLQETFERAFKAVDSFQEGTNAKAWLFRIMKNQFINRYRKKTRAPIQVELEDHVSFQQEEDDTAYSGHTDLRVEMFDQMMGDEVTAAIEQLKPEFRNCVILSDVEDFSYEEIASILDIPIGTVRSRLHRGRALLRRQLVDYAAQQGVSSQK